MAFSTEEDNAKQLRNHLNDMLPEENEVIITTDGLVIVDEEGPLRPEEIGTPVEESILCGC